MEDLDTELLGQLQRWHEEDQYQADHRRHRGHPPAGAGL